MSTTPTILASLVRREFHTRKAISTLDDKIQRLRSARAQRAGALKKIRHELAKVAPTEPVAADQNERDTE